MAVGPQPRNRATEIRSAEVRRDREVSEAVLTVALVLGVIAMCLVASWILQVQAGLR